MKTVQVLLSTYNGSKYLERQLDSIFDQKEVRVKLLVRDDGSTDNTRKILEKYKKKFSLTIILGSNLGFAKSFWRLVQKANNADYYAFCDQDDIWENDKLISAVKKIEDKHLSSSVPVLYTSNVTAINNNLKIIKKKAFAFDGVLTFPDSLQRSVLPGCTFVFNDALLKYARKYNGKIIAHDWLMYQLAELFGIVVYDNKPHMKYRIHEGNTIGISSPTQELVDKIKRQFTTSNVPRRSEIAQNILNTYTYEIPANKKRVLKLFTQAKSPRYWYKILKIKEYRNVDFILMLLLGRI